MSVRTLRYNTIEQHFTKGVTASTDRDALAFLEAAQIYNTNQQRAIVNLVRSLKRVGLWSKMKAIYPFVGGTATSHKFNLKDPRDVDAAFRLTFSGGWTHSSTGADPNGTNGYANTFLKPFSILTQYNTHFSTYIRENVNSASVDLCSSNNGSSRLVSIYPRINNRANADTGNYLTSRIDVASTDSTGFWTVKRSSSTDLKLFRNGSQFGSNTTTDNSELPDFNTFLSAVIIGNESTAQQYSSRQTAFATIGDGLTDTDATNLYNIVQRYQFQLGRAIEPDAQAFIDAAGITDATQQAAILDLVVRLKNDGLWSKMKAIYPFVGGTATSHKWNLKDPRDVNAAYRLSFTGGFTHNSEGIIGNGTNAVADSFINLSSITSGYSCNISVYMRTAGAGPSHGCANALATLVVFYPIRSGKANSALFKYSPFMIPDVNTTGKGLFAQNREDGTTEMIYYNGSLLKSQALAATGKPTFTMRVMGFAGQAPFTPEYNAATMSSMTVGDGLTSTEQQTLYNIIDLYQKRLGRAV